MFAVRDVRATVRWYQSIGFTPQNEYEDGGERFEEDLYTPFYGGRQFSIRDINDLALIFWQPELYE